MNGAREPGRLHVITDVEIQNRFTHEELARMAAAGGASTVQFREKRALAAATVERTARHMLAAVRPHAVRLLIDDRVDVCARVGADGVHLGATDVAVAVARSRLGPEALIGGTANEFDEALRVAATAVDYLGVGPVYGTRSKSRPARRLGLATLRRIVRAVDKPVIAIGGITVERVREVMETGVWGIAVLSAVAAAERPDAEVRRFRAALEAARACEVDG